MRLMWMIATLIRTLNEVDGIEHCIRYHRPYVDYILVWDGGSTDGTIQLAENLADHVIVNPDKHWGRFTTNAVYSIPKQYEWCLIVDVDEQFDKDYLRRMRSINMRYDTLSYRFPRVNLPEAREYPDYQVRMVRTDADIVWLNKVYEVPTVNGEIISKLGHRGCLTLHKYPIIHNPP